MDSLLPRIWAVEAVGMGAKSRLFLTPCLRTHRGSESGVSYNHHINYM